MSEQKLIKCRRISVDCIVTDEMYNHIINECSKMVQKEYKIRHDWVGKNDALGIEQDIKISPCWQMYGPGFILENELHKYSETEIQMDHSIPARKLDLVLNKKKKRNCHLEDFAIPADHREKIKVKR